MTKRCYSLKQHLEELAKAGHLRRYLGDGQKQHYHEGPTVAHNTKPMARVIEMIHTSRPSGKSHDQLRSNLKKAQHLREVFQVAEGSVVSKKQRTDFPNSEQQIFFSDEDLRDVQTLHDDPLVAKLRIGDSDVKRVLIDQGSCSEIMYPNLFHRLGLKQSNLQPYDTPLGDVSFGWDIKAPSHPGLRGLPWCIYDFVCFPPSPPQGVLASRGIAWSIMNSPVLELIEAVLLSNWCRSPTLGSDILQSFVVKSLGLSSLHSRMNLRSYKLSLIEKIITMRSFNHSVVRDIVTKAWNLSFPISVMKMDRNVFLFSFQHEVDLNLVFRCRPWTLRGAHLILKVWKPELNWNEVDFSTSTFWIQVHGLPFLWQNKPNLSRIGSKAGKVIEVDFVGDSPPRWHKLVRLRVEVDITVPLKPGMFFPRKELSDVWIGLKYEKLPEFCYKSYGPWMHFDNNENPLGIFDNLISQKDLNESLETGFRHKPTPQTTSPSLTVPLLVRGNSDVDKVTSPLRQLVSAKPFVPIDKGVPLEASLAFPFHQDHCTSLLEPKIRTEVCCHDSKSISLPGNDTRPSSGTPTTQATNNSPIPVDPIPVCTPSGPGNGDAKLGCKLDLSCLKSPILVDPILVCPLSGPRDGDAKLEPSLHSSDLDPHSKPPVSTLKRKFPSHPTENVSIASNFDPDLKSKRIKKLNESPPWSIHASHPGFHGPPHKAKRRKAWVNLHGLLESIDGPWMCFGDFNVLIDESKKEGDGFDLKLFGLKTRDVLRWIAENQLVVHELLHSFKMRKVKGGFVAIKVDLQKAYDRVNWSFLRAVLLKFGFHEVFVFWVMQCVSTVSFSVLINGGKSKCFQPSRGLGKGTHCPLTCSSLCQEVLSRLIDKEFAAGVISGVSMNRNGPAFMNVMYADDIMLFTKASNREVQALDACLEKYCQWSGRLVNREKSGLIFSKLVTRERKKAIKLELNMKSIHQNAIYLGAPLFTSRNRSKDFKFLQERLESKLKGWRCKALSWAGRNTLIKSVAQALPNYTFSSFDVPGSVCNKLDAVTRRFWWNPKKYSGNYLAWKSWDHLYLPKSLGGLGFRSSKKFNDALLAKLTWMNASQTWKAIERLKCVIAKGACFLVGDGAMIDIWKDPWVPWLPNFVPQPKEESTMVSFVVSCLIDQNTRTWNNNILEQFFNEESVAAIKQIIIPFTPRPDRLVWISDSKGIFSVKSVFKTCQAPIDVANTGIQWNKLWKLPVHEKLKMMLWRIGSDILPTNKNFVQRVGHGDPMCPLCLVKEESIPTYFSSALPLELCGLAKVWDYILKMFAIKVLLTLKCIWTMRNSAVHKDPHLNIYNTVKGLELRISDHSSSITLSNNHPIAPCAKWLPPSGQVVKLNTDAAVRTSFSTIAVVARDANGFIHSAWSKHIEVIDPEVAEPSAILWAIQLAKLEDFQNFIVESDSKVPVGCMNGIQAEANWKIAAIVSDVNFLSLDFVSCCFSWVKREANMVAHALAKFAVSFNSDFSCNATSLPSPIRETWQRDMLFVS
uniref:Reverse transcriptase domain-containing protein n=1 Tax=Fagus sylvatica TaxID=28930 RepID=A0A2N9I5P8_FAGSY